MTDQIVVWAVPRSFMVPFHIAGTSIDGWNTQIRVIPLAKSLWTYWLPSHDES